MEGFESAGGVEVIERPQTMERSVQPHTQTIERPPQPSVEAYRENLKPRNTFSPNYRGFEQKQQESIKNMVDSVGFYKAGIKNFIHGRSQSISGGEVAGWFDFRNKELALTDAAIRYEGKLGEVIVHELAHSGSPFVNKEAREYYIQTKGYELFDKATMEVVKVAQQSFNTNTYLTGYHKWLGNQLRLNNIDVGQFVEETSAILAETRIINPVHLQQVNDAQVNKLLRNGVHPNQITNLVEASNLQMNLMMDGLNTHDHGAVENHLQNVRQGLKLGVENFCKGTPKQENASRRITRTPNFGIGRALPEPQVIDIETAIIKALKAPRKKPFIVEEPQRGFIWSLLELLELLLLANSLDTVSIGRIKPVSQMEIGVDGRIVVEG